MRTVVFGIISGYSTLCASTSFPLGYQPYIQLSALGVLSATLWILFTRVLPEHRAERKEERDAFMKEQKRMRKAFKKFTKNIIDAMSE